MDVETVLQELGLSLGEAKVYLALLKLGSATVAQLKEETLLHRTTIYDFLEKLMNKGIASYVVKAGVKYFTGAKLAKLFDLIREKQEHLQTILPELQKISEFVKPKLKVEVYKGVEGFKTVLNDVLQTKPEIFYAFGIEEIKFKERFPYIMEQYFRKELKIGIKERLLSKKGIKFVYKAPNLEYRYIPEEFFSPTPTGIYGDNVMIIIWEPLTIIIIENKDLAESWKKHFNFLWKQADKKP